MKHKGHVPQAGHPLLQKTSSCMQLVKPVLFITQEQGEKTTSTELAQCSVRTVISRLVLA